MSQREIVCGDLSLEIDDLLRQGYRLDVIYPADEPHSAVLSDSVATIQVTTRPGAVAPSGELPPFTPEFVLTRADDASSRGRAGMLYRDLIPGRLGGRYIASLITVPDAGPVADWAHYHRIAVQALYVASGWVRVVYEDQGEPFVLHSGDLVLQPPEIRHRVLESSAGLAVIEIAAPALHATFADHQMTLPNGQLDQSRDFSGQRFIRHVGSQAPWTAFREGEAQETRINGATGGLMEVRVLRSGGAPAISFPPHDGELVFGFVLEGEGLLGYREGSTLAAADAFVIPPGDGWRLDRLSEDFKLLHVTTARLG